jgi:hypothetical protein
MRTAAAGNPHSGFCHPDPCSLLLLLLQATRTVASVTQIVSGSVMVRNPTAKPFTVRSISISATIQAANRERRSSSSSSAPTAAAAASSSKAPAAPPKPAASSNKASGSSSSSKPAAQRGLLAAAARSAAAAANFPGGLATWLMPAGSSSSSGADAFVTAITSSSDAGDIEASADDDLTAEDAADAAEAESVFGAVNSAELHTLLQQQQQQRTAGKVTCPTDSNGESPLPAAQRGAPTGISCQFVITLPTGAPPEAAGLLLADVIAAPGITGTKEEDGMISKQQNFSLANR